MQRTMSSEELSKYINQIENPSETFKLFLRHYVTGDILIRGRNEEDISVWDKLKGNELEIAKQIIMNELRIIPDFSYIRAVSIFKDERAIPILISLIETLPYSGTNNCLGERLLAAKALHDLTGYKDYVPMLETACKSPDDSLHSYFKYSIYQFIVGLSETDKARIMKALER